MAVREITIREAITEAITEEMRRDHNVVMIGQTVTEWDERMRPGIGGLIKEFGQERFWPTGITERFEADAGVGAALAGGRPIVHLWTAGFGSLACDEVLTKAGLWAYEHGRNRGMCIPMVFELGYSSYSAGSGAEHARASLGTFMHMVGIKLVVASTPYNAKGYMKTAIRDDNPVVFMWPQGLIAERGPVPAEEYTLPFDQAQVVREGTDCTIVGVGYQLKLALDAAEALAKEGISVEVIDPGSLIPLDIDTIVASVRKTGRLVEADEDWIRCGVGAEILTQVQEIAFDALKAPMQRLGNPNVPVPASPVLIREIMPNPEKIAEAVRTTVYYQAR